MNLPRFATIAVFLLVSSLSVPSLAGPSEDAAAAYKNGDYATALRLWRDLADQGDAKAQTGLGKMYADGRGVAKDDVVAVQWYRKSAEQGYAEAESNLGVRYYTGRGVVKDDAAAAALLRKAADQGYAEAQIWLGLLYARGHGVPHDDGEAVRWYRKAAEQDNPWGQTNLGFMYSQGRGIEKDDVEAVRLFRLAAAQGFAMAQDNLGGMYRDGRGVMRDYAAAVGWFRKAAEQGYAQGQANLGYMYRTGRGGLPQDDKQAVEWYRKAAEQGNTGAQAALNSLEQRQREQVAKRYVKDLSAAPVTSLAGPSEDAAAAYKNGDYATALRLWRDLAEQGLAGAQSNLGLMYRDGRGVTRDDAEAVSWFRKSAEQGDAAGQSNLGKMYEEGRGVAKDETEAAKWYRKAADQGYAAAEANLGVMYEEGRGVAKDESEAAKWYRKAADHGNTTALVRLGQMYQSGRGVPQSETKARIAYRSAAEAGDETGKTLLAALDKERPVPVVLGCLVQIAEWPVRLVRGHLVVDGTINRNKVSVMLDTGADKTLILRSQADRLGLRRSQSGFEGIGIGGRTKVETVLIDEITIEDAVRKGWRMAVAGETDLGGDIGIILGEDFFSRADVELDIEHNLVRLYQAKGCGDKSLAYWMVAGAGEVAIDSVSEVNPEIVFSVRINGQSVDAKLDTGSPASVMHKSVAANLGIVPGMPGVKEVRSLRGIGAEQVQTWIAPIATFVMGKEQISNASIFVADLGRWDIGRSDMLLGMDFLQAHRMLISHSQKKIYFTYSGGPVLRANPVLETRDDPVPEAKAVPLPETRQSH
jgi:TPR repeat protein/predicted aspartyl protease